MNEREGMEELVDNADKRRWKRTELSPGSEVLHMPSFMSRDKASQLLNYLNTNLPWARPTLVIFGRACSQPRETCYIAEQGLPLYKYSGYEPPVHSWEEFPTLKEILNDIYKVLPGTTFNSLLVNRYKSGCDYVGWHSDNELLYGATPTIASVTFGAEREFVLRKKKTKNKEYQSLNPDEIVSNRQSSYTKLEIENSKKDNNPNGLEGSDRRKRTFQSIMMNKESKHTEVLKDKHTFLLKHGSLLVMTGYTQRDWEHSVPKRMKIPGLRINLTFRYILPKANAG